jgi:hypothetical protein
MNDKRHTMENGAEVNILPRTGVHRDMLVHPTMQKLSN